MNRALGAASLCAAVALTSGCGDDEASEYTLALTVDDVSLTADGSDFANVRVTVLDQNGYPPAIGSTVLLQSQNGNVNGTDADAGDALTDITGSADFVVTCDGEDDVNVLAVYEGETGFLNETISCNPAPTGDWNLLVSASPRQVLPGATTTIVIDAVQGDGSAAPQGTAVTVGIQEPNPGAEFRNGSTGPVTLTTTDASGRVGVIVVAADSSDAFSVCASFADQRFGAGERCVTVTVGTAQVGEGCVGSFAPSRIGADGESMSELVFTVFDETGQAVSGATIEAEIGLGSFIDPETGDDEGDVTLSTDISGVASVEILAPATTGTADITATADFDGVDEPLECTFATSLVFQPPPTCRFDDITTLDLGETRLARACFFDFDEPIGAGRRVNFELVSTMAGTSLTATTAFTDASGCATTGISTGTRPGGIQIRASMPFGVNETVCTSEPTIQRGGSTTANEMILACDWANVGALLTRNGVDVEDSCPIVCTANVYDRFNNPVAGAEVAFTSESGGIGASAVTNAQGVASVTMVARGQLPMNVAPFPGEPVFDCGALDYSCNPRDSLISVIASTAGQEAFNDSDGDGVYDVGEFFIDLAEPFVDANDDDDYQPLSTHEEFTDVAVPGRALNGAFDGPNGVWDEFTQIWASTHVVLSGSHVDDTDGWLWTPRGLGSSNVLPGATLRPAGTLQFTPRDVFGNALSSGTSFTVTDNCERLGDDSISIAPSTGDSLGVIAIGREIQHFSTDVPVSPESADANRGEYRTFVDFAADRAEAAPLLVVSIKDGAPGLAEACELTVSWTEQSNRDCAPVLINRSVRFQLDIPTVVP